MNWLVRVMLADWDQAIRNDVANVKAGVTELRMQQAEIMKMLTAINQSVAKLLIKHSQDPQELTNEERAAMLGLPPQAFGNLTFLTTSGTSLKISDAEFGSFASNTISTLISTSGFLNLEAHGTWTGGAFNLGVCAGGCPADMRISFTQTPVATGEISFSATMSTLGVTTVPELPTFALFGTGLMAALITASRLRNLPV